MQDCRMGDLTGRAGLLACTGLIALTISGCSQPPDPIRQPTSSGSVCQPAVAGPVTEGDFTLQNTGSAPAVISKVELRNNHGIRIVGAKIFVFTDAGTGSTLVGTLNTYPPSSGPSAASHTLPWSAGLAVPGATIPADPHAVGNVVMGLERDTSSDGSADGIDVYYESGGHDYTYHGQFAIKLAATRCF
jgi:hypothetical protein